MSEKRRKIASFCLKIEASNTKVVLFDAAAWSDGVPGFARVRIAGKWLDGRQEQRGQPKYLNLDAVAELVKRLLLEAAVMPPAPPRPKLSVGQVVGLEGPPFDADGFGWGTLRGRVLSSDPLLGHDCRWYVAVSVIGRGTRMVAADTLTIFSHR